MTIRSAPYFWVECDCCEERAGGIAALIGTMEIARVRAEEASDDE